MIGKLENSQNLFTHNRKCPTNTYKQFDVDNIFEISKAVVMLSFGFSREVKIIATELNLGFKKQVFVKILETTGKTYFK